MCKPKEMVIKKTRKSTYGRPKYSFMQSRAWDALTFKYVPSISSSKGRALMKACHAHRRGGRGLRNWDGLKAKHPIAKYTDTRSSTPVFLYGLVWACGGAAEARLGPKGQKQRLTTASVSSPARATRATPA